MTTCLNNSTDWRAVTPIKWERRIGGPIGLVTVSDGSDSEDRLMVFHLRYAKKAHWTVHCYLAPVGEDYYGFFDKWDYINETGEFDDEPIHTQKKAKAFIDEWLNEPRPEPEPTPEPEMITEDNLRVRIGFVEGIVNTCPPGLYHLAAARAVLSVVASFAPVQGGYNKVDFALVVDGKDLYEGRLDVMHDGTDSDPIAHVCQRCEWTLSEKGAKFYKSHPKAGDYKAACAEAKTLLERLAALRKS